jgi:hypothetical protein
MEPWPSTTVVSASRTVLSRWATTTCVQDKRHRFSATRCSVSTSKWLGASSSSGILGLFAIAEAIDVCCR